MVRHMDMRCCDIRSASQVRVRSRIAEGMTAGLGGHFLVLAAQDFPVCIECSLTLPFWRFPYHARVTR